MIYRPEWFLVSKNFSVKISYMTKPITSSIKFIHYPHPLRAKYLSIN